MAGTSEVLKAVCEWGLVSVLLVSLMLLIQQDCAWPHGPNLLRKREKDFSGKSSFFYCLASGEWGLCWQGRGMKGRDGFEWKRGNPMQFGLSNSDLSRKGSRLNGVMTDLQLFDRIITDKEQKLHTICTLLLLVSIDTLYRIMWVKSTYIGKYVKL